MESELILQDVLHAPSIGYTLVSLGALDKLGYQATLGGGHLEIFSLHGERVGCVVQTAHGLYRVKHSPDLANAVELLSVMELHRRLGHIAAASACKLVESRAVIGVQLDPNSQEAECDACIFAHATCQPIPCVCISPPAQHFCYDPGSSLCKRNDLQGKDGSTSALRDLTNGSAQEDAEDDVSRMRAGGSKG